jgi:hypothetical protein
MHIQCLSLLTLFVTQLGTRRWSETSKYLMARYCSFYETSRWVLIYGETVDWKAEGGMGVGGVVGVE